MTTAEIVLRLGKLRADCDAVIAKLSPKRVKGAINWGDLCCRDARHYVSCDGDEGYTVIVSEAAPDAGELPAAIQNGLYRLGWTEHVEVVTEW
jgi:hypothetical protein